MLQAAREAFGEVDEGEGLSVEHWLLPLPGQPGEQVHAGCGETLLADHGDDGDAQLARKLKKTRWEAQGWLQFQASSWSCLQQLKQTRKLAPSFLDLVENFQ